MARLVVVQVAVVCSLLVLSLATMGDWQVVQVITILLQHRTKVPALLASAPALSSPPWPCTTSRP